VTIQTTKFPKFLDLMLKTLAMTRMTRQTIL
jgi:hypothetical protein